MYLFSSNLCIEVSTLSSNFMQRISRPRGGINEWLHWLPVSLHKKFEHVIRRIRGRNRVQPLSHGINGRAAKKNF